MHFSRRKLHYKAGKISHVVVMQFSLQTEHSYQHLPGGVFSFCRFVFNRHKELIKRFQTTYKACFNFPECHLHSFCTLTAKHSDHSSMVPAWLALPPHSKIPLFESWPWSFECRVCMFWLCLCQFPTTPKHMLHVVDK